MEQVEEATEVAITPIRDATFVRLFADIGLCVNTPEGIEIALLQRMSAYRDVVMGDLYPRRASQGTMLSDVARLRMSDQDASALAFNILLTLAQSGIVEISGFDENVERVREIIRTAQAD